ncbi:hypothetical protein RGQ29_027334 [Quercus rubra]|uniref:RING-type E3 ubiquitin transferase n=1 Tax=Quercus rubra TaxID=3512 RepID=A0AAN7ENT8_QUERU|nr:hypothetical protein RGQ29_027334 [Quercus rubra]
MNSFEMTNSSPKWHSLPWFFIIFFLSTTFPFFSVTSSASQDIYDEHCSSTVADSKPNQVPLPKLPFPRTHNGYYTDGDKLHNQHSNSYYPSFSNSISLRRIAVHGTDNPGLFKVELSLTFQVSNIYYRDRRGRRRRNSVTFKLQGYWSEPEGNLCAVGTGFTYSKEDHLLKLSAVLKLSNLTKSTNITSLITGTLESLSSDNKDSYFDPISMLLFPQMNYKYSYVSDDSKDRCSGGSNHLPKGLSLSSLPTRSSCSIFARAVNPFNLKYSWGCVSAKNCSNPLDKNIGYVPNLMSLSKIECSEDEERMRVLVEFASGRYIGSYRHFSPNMALVGEGSWDESKNQLCIVACRFMGMAQSFSGAHLGDCSTMLSLRFPAVWSIRGVNSIVGQLWSERSVNESGYFNNIMFQSGSNHMQGRAAVSSVKYEYSKIDIARKSCSNPAKTKGKVYPNAFSHEMSFDMSVKISKGKMGWGYSTPISVNNQLLQYSSYMESEEPANFNSSGPVNISYHIGLTMYSTNSTSSRFNASLKLLKSFEILAEGLYDAETGILCMVGCRTIDSNDYWDCEILVNFEFPSTNKRNSGPIKGTIQSTREKFDDLYFEVLNLTANAYYRDLTSIRRMDAEIIMVLISTTLSCVFVGLQLFHVKRHSHVLPFTSLVMLSILTLGYMIPLVLNFEALFVGNYRQQRIVLNSGGWIEANEVIVRMVGMVVFLFQFRLLHRTWSARRGEGNQKALWVAEKRVLFVVLPLCAAGALVAVIANWVNNENVAMVNSTLRTNSRSYWRDLKSFASLVLDGFLLPQILLNLFLNSRKRALSCAFYMGNTIVRLLPHTYDLYRAHNYFHQYDGSYIYANPGADFYSTAWDVVIPLGGLVFALIIFLQQRFGGRFILPRRFRELEGYEKVPVVSDA